MNDTSATPSNRLTLLASQLTGYEGRFVHPDKARDRKTVKAMADKHFAVGNPPAVIPGYEDAYHAACLYFNFQEVAAISQLARARTAGDIKHYAESGPPAAPVSYVADNMVSIMATLLEDKNRLKALYAAHRVPVAAKKQEVPGAAGEPEKKAALSYHALVNVAGEFVNASHLHKRFPDGVDGQAVKRLLAKEESVLRQEYGNDEVVWDTCIRLFQAAQKFTEAAESITGIRAGKAG